MHQNRIKFLVKIFSLLLISFCSLEAQKEVINDPLNGSTKGIQVGGTLTTDGFKPRPGKYFKPNNNTEDHILYEVTKANGGKVIENGYVEFQVKGFRMSDFEPTSPTIKSRESGFMVLYDGRGVSEPLKYDPDSKHNYFYWVIHYRSEKYQASVGNKWKTIINAAEPIDLRINSTKAVFNDATGNNGIVDAKDGKINLLDRDWTVEPNGIRTSWDPNKWYTIRVQWDNVNREFKVFRDGQLVWFNELEEGRSWKSYDNSVNPAPYPWRPLDLKIWLGSGTGRYDNDMKNMYYRNFKVVDLGGSSSDPPPPPPPTTPSITVTSPNGGEKLQVGKTHNIRWTENKIAKVKIEYSTNSGSSWNLIASEATNNGTYSWLVPNTPSVNCIVRLTGTVSGKTDVSNSKFTIQTESTPPPSSDDLVVVSPNGGESWEVGSTQNITWSGPPDVDNVIIFFSSDYDPNNTTAAQWTKIAYVPNSGSYSWFVPNKLSTNCIIRIKAANNPSNVDIGDAVFSIIKSGGTPPPPPPPPPSGDELAVVSPNGGESWGVGNVHQITWTAPSSVKNVNIFFSSNYNPKNPTSAIWTKIAYAPNTGSYNWTIPNSISSNCLIRIKDIADRTLVDIGDEVFSIVKDGTPPPPPSGDELTVVSPNGGEKWSAGSVQKITWTTPSGVKNVNIFFASNYDPNNPTATVWKKIAYTPNTGSYNWTVSNNISSNCVIRIKDVNNSSNVDLGDNNFSIIAPQVLTKQNGASGNDMIAEIPDEFSLEQNYPNPFNPTTEIKFALKKSQNVKITVYNLMGEEVKQLVNNQLNAGIHYVSFDASEYASGVYIYRLVSEDFTATKRMTLLK